MKRFSVNKISYSQPSKGYRIVLEEIGSANYFSILIGNLEAQSVALALEGVQTPRPMTHDIIIDILESSDIKIHRIEINKFENDTFFSRILIKSYNFGIKSIDCRPSDAISIALKCNYPIFIENEGLLLSGDALFKESIGRTDLYNGDVSLLLNSIHQELLSLGDEVEVFPGHGPSTTIGHEKLHNPFLVN